MTDLEMTRLCAEAMGHETCLTQDTVYMIISEEPPDWARPLAVGGKTAIVWDPLHNDAQAMALVKRFPMEISHFDSGMFLVDYKDGYVESDDLNRAIVECVARMKSA